LQSGRTKEIQRLIGRSLRAALNLEHLGERTLIVDCDVIQADGGTRTAAITGGYVAVVLALRRLIAAGLVPPEVLRTPVAAVSVGIVEGEPRLDLCYAEDSVAEVDFNVVMTGDGRFVEIQGTAEGRPFTAEEFAALMELARKGIAALLEAQARALAEAPELPPGLRVRREPDEGALREAVRQPSRRFAPQRVPHPERSHAAAGRRRGGADGGGGGGPRAAADRGGPAPGIPGAHGGGFRVGASSGFGTPPGTRRGSACAGRFLPWRI
jgi:hypothetical protein